MRYELDKVANAYKIAGERLIGQRLKLQAAGADPKKILGLIRSQKKHIRSGGSIEGALALGKTLKS